MSELGLGCASVGRLLSIALAALVAALVPPTSALGAAQPYQQNDGKGFVNIAPPGANGFATLPQIGAFLTSPADNRAYPPHSNDQLAMYGDLVYATPGLKPEDVNKYFKDASFGVKPQDIDRTYTPRADVTIVRDKQFGVPHIYGDTRAGTMFGAGYVAAEDRLFFIDVLRHLGRAQLSSFAGGAPGNRVFDAEQWALAPYTEADLQKQVDQFPALYGAEGKVIQDDVASYTQGVNAYIAEARVNPAKMPGEYAAINRPQGPDDWQDRDAIAIAALVGGIFGKGGGREVDSALVYQSAVARFGKRRGPKVWADFRSQNDPEAPTTVRKRFPYELVPKKVAGGSRALPDPGSFKRAQTAAEGTPGAGGPGGGAPTCVAGIICLPRANSNALVVGAQHSQSGKPLAVFGPQTGYFAPQILMEQDMHGPGIDARGAAFPGVNLYIQLGRGRDYAWSATSAGQDNTDQFAVDLCNPDGSPATIDSQHYRYRGSCRPIEVIERTNSWVPSAADQTPAGSEKLTVGRTALGVVIGRGTVAGKPVAYTSLRSTYFHEVDSARGFVDFNNPDKMKSPADFQRAAHKIGYTFNWLYVDDENVAYFNSGNNPVRAKNVDPNFPVRARNRYEWKRFNPDNLTAAYTPFSQHPRVVNQPWITSWNNKQAPGYSASDANWGFSSVYRSDSLDAQIQKRVKGGRKMSLVELIDAMEVAGTTDLRATQVLPYALKVLGKQKDPALRDAIAKLRAWQRSGGQRIDHDRNGVYESAEAIRILDAWWPRWMRAQFEPALGKELFEGVQGMTGLDNAPNNHGDHLGSAYQDGWYGYAKKDLRTVLRQRVQGKYSRRYCGGGKPSRCRAALAASLRDALAHSSPAEVYGDDEKCVAESGGDGDRLQYCYDTVVHRPLGAIQQPRIHWINRPTFQQAVEIQGRAR
jgi:acyl-homoserine lactone acylase PvdQ